MNIFNPAFKSILRAFVFLFNLSFFSAVEAFDVPDEVQAIFNANCLTGCHMGNTPSGGLSLDNAAVSEAALVNIVANCSTNNELLVDPGSPQTSILYQKISSQNPACGGRMPPGGNMLSNADLNTIFDWIVSIGPAAQFGLINLAETAVTVQETDPSVTISVVRELGTQGAISVDYVVSTVGTDTATSPSDYVENAGTLTFADGEVSKDIVVMLADDDVFEGTEVFSITLSNVQGGAVLGAASQAKVSITDNEFDNQPGTFFFSRVSYDVAEDAGTLDITVIRSFGAAGQVSVNYSTADGSALAAADYQAANATLIFEEGVKNQTFSLNIIDDDVEESGESFTLTLSNPNNGALLGSPASVTVNINDNDGANSGGGNTGGGDTGGGDNGGGTEGGDGSGGTDPNQGQATEPAAEEADFTEAGSISVLFTLLLLSIFVVSGRLRKTPTH